MTGRVPSHVECGPNAYGPRGGWRARLRSWLRDDTHTVLETAEGPGFFSGLNGAEAEHEARQRLDRLMTAPASSAPTPATSPTGPAAEPLGNAPEREQ